MNQSVAPDTMHAHVAAVGDPPADLTALLARRRYRGTAEPASPSNAHRPLTRPDEVDARALVGLASVPTIVAIGPFDDHAHAQQLADAFTTVRHHCNAQLVLLGAGVQRTAVTRRTCAQGVGAACTW